MNTTFKKLGALWCAGLVMFALRLYQNLTAFDPLTGLCRRSGAGIALAVAVVLCGAASFALSLRSDKERPSFADHFRAPGNAAPLVSAAFLFAAGGVFLAKSALGAELRIAALVTAALALLSCFALLLFTRQLRSGSAASVAPMLPLMFFSAFWVLTLYLPTAADPVLARYYLPTLTAAVTAYALGQLAGFFRKETRVRTFRFTASYALMLCIASVAELNAHSVLFAACALLLSVFLTLERE